jgi:hypothetical protein
MYGGARTVALTVELRMRRALDGRVTSGRPLPALIRGY